MIFGFDEYLLDIERLELRRSGKPVKADALVLRLLAALVQDAGRLLTKEELVTRVWEGRAVADNVLTVSMARLRKTLGVRGSQREYVVTVYGRGYRFDRPVASHGPSLEVQLPAPMASEPPFVGRERVLARLTRALSEASAGRGRACVLLGEPGIGKTRAVEMLEQQAAAAHVGIAFGYCREAGDTPPLWPLQRILRKVLSVTAGHGIPQALRVEVDRVLDAPVRDASARELSLPWAGSARHRSIDALVRILSLSAQAMPWLFVLEDLHRADAASLELLASWLDEIGHCRILLVATVRPDPANARASERGYLSRVLGHRNCERIELDRLSGQDVATYVSALVDDPNGALGRAVYDKSEGNPFFMAELARKLRDDEHPDPETLAVPHTALELMRQHLATLPKGTLEVLKAAAVLGRSFELPQLAQVTGSEFTALMADLDRALEAEVVVAEKGSPTAFAFGHELMRGVLYDGLAPAERRAMHLRTARVLQARSDLGDAIPANELAFHFHAALPEGDLRATVRACSAAAATAANAFANLDVVRHTRHMLEALELMPAPSVRLRMRSLQTIAIYARTPAPEECRRALSELIGLARAQGDGVQLVHAARMLAHLPGRKPMPGAAQVLQEGLARLPPEERATRAIALSALACCAPNAFDRVRSQALIDEAVEYARVCSLPLVLHPVLRCHLYLQGGPGPETQALVDELEHLALQNADALPVLSAELALARAQRALQDGDGTALQLACERAVTRCRELHGGDLLWHSERMLAIARIDRGGGSEALRALQELDQRAEQRALINTEPLVAFDRAVVLGDGVEEPASRARLRTALAYDAQEPPSIWALKLRGLVTLGFLDQARAGLHEVSVPALLQLPADADYLGTLGHLVRVALALGANDYFAALERLLQPYAERFAGGIAGYCEGSVAQLLGMLVLGQAQPDRARLLLEQGLAQNERAGLVARVAETRQLLAQLRATAVA